MIILSYKDLQSVAWANGTLRHKSSQSCPRSLPNSISYNNIRLNAARSYAFRAAIASAATPSTSFRQVRRRESLMRVRGGAVAISGRRAAGSVVRHPHPPLGRVLRKHNFPAWPRSLERVPILPLTSSQFGISECVEGFWRWRCSSQG